MYFRIAFTIFYLSISISVSLVNETNSNVNNLYIKGSSNSSSLYSIYGENDLTKPLQNGGPHSKVHWVSHSSYPHLSLSNHSIINPSDNTAAGAQWLSQFTSPGKGAKVRAPRAAHGKVIQGEGGMGAVARRLSFASSLNRLHSIMKIVSS